MPPLRQRAVLLALVPRMDIGSDQVIIHLRSGRLAAFLKDRLVAPNLDQAADEPTLPLCHPLRLRSLSECPQTPGKWCFLCRTP